MGQGGEEADVANGWLDDNDVLFDGFRLGVQRAYIYLGPTRRHLDRARAGLEPDASLVRTVDRLPYTNSPTTASETRYWIAFSCLGSF